MDRLRLEKAIEEMKLAFKDLPYGIEHTTRVLENAGYILNGEAVSGPARETVFLAAVLHDIGAVEAQRKYGSLEGHFQELEGPPVARSILERIGTPANITERVCYIVAHHHTPAKIDGLDFQILWEADLLESLQAGAEKEERHTLRQKVLDNFRTASGRRLAGERLGLASPER